jgi:hypothetical protein
VVAAPSGSRGASDWRHDELLAVSAINHDEESASHPGVGKKAWNDPAGRDSAIRTAYVRAAVP